MLVGDHDDIDQTIKLIYPKNYEVYPLMVPLKDDYDPMTDILDTMKIIGIELDWFIGEKVVSAEHNQVLGTYKTGIIKKVRKAVKNGDIHGLMDGVLSYNSGMISLREKGVFSQIRNSNLPANIDIIEHVMEQSYARIVAPKTNSLRKYEGISICKLS